MSQFPLRAGTAAAGAPADSVASSMYKRLSEKPRRPREVREDLPAFLEKIILRCLERDPKRRYPFIGMMVRELQAALYV